MVDITAVLRPPRHIRGEVLEEVHFPPLDLHRHRGEVEVPRTGVQRATGFLQEIRLTLQIGGVVAPEKAIRQAHLTIDQSHSGEHVDLAISIAIVNVNLPSEL